MSHWEARGKSDDWFTPKWIFDALSCHFDLDVAAPVEGPKHVPCYSWLWRKSLDKCNPWHGFVWMNPPFGGRNAIEPWLAKFFQHGNGIALTPDRTSAPWFQTWAPRATGVMFLPKVKFERPDGTLGKSPSNGTALMAAGDYAYGVLVRSQLRGVLLGGYGALARMAA